MTQFLNWLKKYWWACLVVIVILALAIYRMSSLWPKRSNTQETGNVSRTDIVQEFQSASNVPKVTTNDTRGPGGTPASPTEQTYRNDTLRIEATLPKETVISQNNNQLTAAASGTSYWTIETYDNTRATLTDIETQLRQSPSVTGLTRTTLGGETALQYTSNVSATNFAVIHNGRLYYLTGNFEWLKKIKFY